MKLPASPRFRKAVRIILPVASIALLAALLWTSDLPALAAALQRADLLLLGAAALLELTALELRVLRWRLFVRTFSPITLGQAAASYFPALFLSNFTPGRVGEPVRALFLKAQLPPRDRDSFSAVTALPAIIVERAFDVLALILLSLIALAAVATVEIAAALAVLLALVAAATLVIFRKPALLTAILKRLRLAKGDTITQRLQAGTKLPPRTLVPGFLLSLAVWALEGAVFWLAFTSIGIHLGPAVVSFFAFSVIVGLITLLPGGIGSTEFSLSALVASSAAVPLATATAGAFLGRLATFWLAMVVAAIWWRRTKL